MATTTAAITISSTDLLSNPLNLTKTATLTEAGGSSGLSETTGLARTKLTDTTIKVIYADAEINDNGASKLYVFIPSITAEEYVTITIGTTVLGRVYAGDWVFIPILGDADVSVTASVANVVVEHMVLLDQSV